MKELVEFMSPLVQLRDGFEAQNQGRKSGSEVWKSQRQELLVNDINENIKTIKPTKKEMEAKSLM